MKKKSAAQRAVDFIKRDVTTYDERADKQKRETIKMLMTEAIADFDAGVSEIAQGGKAIMRGVNRIYDAGRKFKQAQEVGQLEFKLFESEMPGWAKEYERRLKVKAAIKAFEILGKRVEKFAECDPVMQLIFETAGLIEKTRRLGGETLHPPRNPFNEIIETAATIKNWFKEWEPPDSPLEAYYAGCGVETLQQIEQATRPMAERHAIVQRLLKEKEGVEG
jgi:hypothetical protein